MSHREAAELLVKSNILPTEGSVAAGSRFKCADARSRFKCANARLRFKEKQAADYNNFTQICSVAAGLKFKV